MITQNKKREMLLSGLREKWENANITVFNNNTFKQGQRAKMILEISDYLESSKDLTGQNEEYILYSLLKLIAGLMVEIKPELEKAVERQLQTLEAYNKKRGVGKQVQERTGKATKKSKGDAKEAGL